MRLKSADGELEFRAFMRRSEDLPENFSIGLVFLPQDGTGEVTLLRCNGPHGAFNDSFDPAHPHSDFHVHRGVYFADIAQGRLPFDGQEPSL